MRNITVLIGLVIILCAQPVVAQNERPYSFSLGSQFGFFYGQAEEIVYPSSEFKADLLSQLLWDMKPVFYIGLLADFSRRNPMEKWGGFANLSFKYGLPRKSGKMEDRDWESYENTALTSFSSHDNQTNKLFLLDLSAGFSVPLNRIILLKAYLNVSYMHLGFSGFNGYGKYARGNPPYSGKYYPIDDNPTLKDYYGKVINYTQNWFHIAPGVSFGFFFHKNFSAELSFAISPLIFCNDEDQHLTTNVQFLDIMRGGLLIEPGLNFSFIANKWIELSLGCSWRHISKTRGETYWRKPIGEGAYFQQGMAGAGFSFIDTGFSLKVHF
jgi:outer membrane protease